MAGLFGLFNFEKEGPGIEKNAPKKKTFIVFFETFFRNFWKFITVNFVYSLISLPVLTGGLASAGLTNVARNTAREKHSFGLSDFFETIKKNWKQALPAGIINAVLYALILFAAYFYYNSTGVMAVIGLGISMALFLVFSMMNLYIWTLMITFKFSLKQIYKNAYKFAIIGLFKNFLCLLLLVLVHVIYVALALLILKISFKAFLLGVTLLIMLYILTYPAFKYLLTQYIVFPYIKKYIIDPYYAEHPDEDLDKRRDLGIEIEEDEEDDEEDTEDTVPSDDNDDDDGEELVFNY